jgi:hypothetical protein
MKQQPPSDGGLGDAGPVTGGAVPGAAFGATPPPAAPDVAVDAVGAWAALGAAARAVASAPLWRL